VHQPGSGQAEYLGLKTIRIAVHADDHAHVLGTENGTFVVVNGQQHDQAATTRKKLAMVRYCICTLNVFKALADKQTRTSTID
jgi:hypothetical protein